MFTGNKHRRSRNVGRPFSLQFMVVLLICPRLVGAPALSTDNVVSIGLANNGQSVAIEKWQMIEVELQSSLALGHQWMLDTGSLNPHVLSEVGITDSSDSDSGCNRWLFSAKDSGVSDIKLSKKNLSDETVFETFEVSVTVLAEPNERPSPFSLVVQHNRVNDAIVGQKCVFLITVIDEGNGYGKGEPVNISATNLLQDTTVSIEPKMLVPGKVGEITVIPGEFVQPQAHDPNEIFDNGDRLGNGDPNEIATTQAIEYMECVVAIAAERNGVRRETLLSLNVYLEEDLVEPVASEYRDSFIPYLASKYPELGITEDTVWKGTVVRPRYLVVTYYLFFSEQWEMGVRWHIMIPPYDWAEMYLRKRGQEFGCTHAFKISSIAAHQEPQVVDVFPEGIWR